MTKLVFYTGFVPLWEGYDEFQHFAFVQHLVNLGEIPDLQNSSVSREVTNSLSLAPVPWTIRQWRPDWITHDSFWSLPAHARQQRIRDLKNTPLAAGWELDRSQRLYEAQQPPLVYLLYSIPYVAFHRASLLTRAWIVRVAGCMIVSLVVPLAFLLAWRVFDIPTQALGAAAIVASMPELMLTADHGGNEPLAIVFATALAWALCMTLGDFRRALLAGCLLGCGLLTKAYFLTLIPALFVICAMRYRRHAVRPLLVVFSSAFAIAGWWYFRAISVTGTLTGTHLSVVAGQSGKAFRQAIAEINWLRVADFALVSHIWIGGWSFLVLRTWMYRGIELFLLAAVAGLALRFARKRASGPLSACIVLLICFWAGMAYFAYSTYLATGEAAVLGYYACALIAPEAVCLIAGISALIPTFLRRIIAPVLVTCFAAAELYGTVLCLMPYYAGITAHTPRGNVPAMNVSLLANGGTGELFRNLAVNKPDFLSAGILMALWIACLVGIAGIVAVSYLAAFSERGKA